MEAESASEKDQSSARALNSPRIGPSKLKDQIKKKKGVFAQHNHAEIMNSDECSSDATDDFFAQQDTF